MKAQTSRPKKSKKRKSNKLSKSLKLRLKIQALTPQRQWQAQNRAQSLSLMTKAILRRRFIANLLITSNKQMFESHSTLARILTEIQYLLWTTQTLHKSAFNWTISLLFGQWHWKRRQFMLACFSQRKKKRSRDATYAHLIYKPANLYLKLNSNQILHLKHSKHLINCHLWSAII